MQNPRNQTLASERSRTREQVGNEAAIESLLGAEDCDAGPEEAAFFVGLSAKLGVWQVERNVNFGVGFIQGPRCIFRDFQNFSCNLVSTGCPSDQFIIRSCHWIGWCNSVFERSQSCALWHVFGPLLQTYKNAPPVRLRTGFSTCALVVWFLHITS